jgi:hypothetical protein
MPSSIRVILVYGQCGLGGVKGDKILAELISTSPGDLIPREEQLLLIGYLLA